METKPHPKLSYGNHITEDDLVVIKVDEGDYEGTVFSYSDVKFLEDSDDNLAFTVDFHVFCHKGEIIVNVDDEPTIMQKFHDEISSPFMYNILVSAANAAKEEPTE